MNRISFEEVHEKLGCILRRYGFSEARAAACAYLFAEATRDGVYTHGVARFPRLVAMIQNGSIDVEAEPKRVAHFGALERWDGCSGPGNLNAQTCMARAMELSREHGIGCVALGNTNHWMRGGSYGWQAVDAVSLKLLPSSSDSLKFLWFLREVTPLGEPDPEVWQKTSAAVESGVIAKEDYGMLLDALGLGASWSKCSNCQKEVAYFLPKDIIFMCQQCFQRSLISEDEAIDI